MQRATSVSESEGAKLAFAPDLTVGACSKAYGRLLDVANDAVVGRPIREAFPAGPALDRLIEALERVLRSARPQWDVEAAEARLRSIMQTVPDAMIWVEDRPGGGTIFRFSLRAATIEEAADAG